jgi:hypothetical protein
MRFAKLTAALTAGAACVLAPAAALTVAMAPTAGADVCGDVGGRHVSVGGCTDIARDAAVGAAVADPNDVAGQMAAGLPPCYTPEGVPFYTPAGVPCP